MEKGFSVSAVGLKTDAEDSLKIMEHSKNRQNKKADKKQGKNIYAGGLGAQDEISEKFARTQKKAIKKILEQFTSDMQIDDEMQARSKHIEELDASSAKLREELEDVNKKRQELKEVHNIDPESQEQKDLELMQKAKKAEENPFEYQLTPEEEQRLSEMPPLTAYQQDMLYCDAREKNILGQLADNQKEATIEKATIEATKKALLKVHPMVDARKDAEELMETARKEAISMLFEEGKDKIEEDANEAAKEIAENKAEKLEEEIRRAKLEEEEAERRAREEEIQDTVFSTTMQTMSYTQQSAEMVQTTIKNLIQDQTLLDVDLKGLRVDKQV